MTRSFRTKPQAICLAEKGERIVAPERIQVLRTGKWKYGSRRFTVTTASLLKLKENFEKGVRGQDIPLDFEHDAEGPAAAWFKELIVENNGTELWAAVEWTPKGREAVESKEYRYTSTEFSENYEDLETEQKFGETLLGVGLLNRPHIKRMAPVTELAETTEDDEMTELEKAQAQIKTLTEQNEKLAKEVSDLKPQVVKLSELEGKVTKLSEENASLKGESEKAVKLAEKNREFDKKLEAGAVVEAQRKPFLEGNMDEFLKLAEKVNSGAAGDGGAGEGGGAKKDGKKSAEDEVISLAEKMVSEKKAKDVREAQSLVLRENPELKKRLRAEQQEAAR